MGKKKNHHSSAAGKVAVGGAIAGVVGYTVGLLTSPRSGKQNRLKVKRVAKKGRKATEKELKKVQKELTEIVNSSKELSKNMGKKAQGEYGLLIDKAKNSKESVREVISAVKEGSAKDKDLDNAVKDAKAVIVHTKDYLKKK